MRTVPNKTDYLSSPELARNRPKLKGQNRDAITGDAFCIPAHLSFFDTHRIADLEVNTQALQLKRLFEKSDCQVFWGKVARKEYALWRQSQGNGNRQRMNILDKCRINYTMYYNRKHNKTQSKSPKKINRLSSADNPTTSRENRVILALQAIGHTVKYQLINGRMMRVIERIAAW